MSLQNGIAQTQSVSWTHDSGPHDSGTVTYTMNGIPVANACGEDVTDHWLECVDLSPPINACTDHAAKTAKFVDLITNTPANGFMDVHIERPMELNGQVINSSYWSRRSTISITYYPLDDMGHVAGDSIVLVDTLVQTHAGNMVDSIEWEITSIPRLGHPKGVLVQKVICDYIDNPPDWIVDYEHMLYLPVTILGPIDAEVAVVDSSITPALVRMVLHDPPGDGSYAAYTTGAITCRTEATSLNQDESAGVTGRVKVGVKGSIGFIATIDYEAYVEVSASIAETKSTFNENSEEVCVEFMSEYATSDNDNVIGGSVFIGYADKIYYGLFDEVYIDNCSSIGIRSGLAYYSEKEPSSEFFYHEDDIQEQIDLLLVTVNNTNLSDRVRDEALNQVDVWQDVLTQNQLAKENGIYAGDKNFTSAVAYMEQYGISSTMSQTQSFEVVTQNAGAIDAVVEIGGSGVSATTEFSLTKSRGGQTGNSTNTTMSSRFFLADDDTDYGNDIFSVRQYRDPQFGTAYFTYNSGTRTSCPYEGGTQRDQLTIYFANTQCGSQQTKFQDMRDEQRTSGNPGTFDIKVCNDNPNENRIASISLDRPGGGVLQVRLDGVTLKSWANGGISLGTIDAGECETFTLEVFGSVDTFNDLEFRVFPTCAVSNAETDEYDFAIMNIIFHPSITTTTLSAICEDNNLLFVKKNNQEEFGVTWEYAFHSLQDALDVANPGDTICVAGGTYYPDEGSDRIKYSSAEYFEMKPGVVILGGFEGQSRPGNIKGNRDVDQFTTVLSGNILREANLPSKKSIHVVYNNDNGLDRDAILDGFTISDGNAVGHQSAGGMHNIKAHPTIRNCIFENNKGDQGAVSVDSSNTRFENCIFRNNSNPAEPNFWAGGGGAIQFRPSDSLRIIACHFENNYSLWGGGAICLRGQNSSSIGNSSDGSGGAVIDLSSDAIHTATVVFESCSFSDNFSQDGGQVYWGGLYATDVHFNGCILWNNHASQGIPIHSFTTINVNHSIVEDCCTVFSGTGILNVDPMFINDTSDLRLRAGSPAVDTVPMGYHALIDQDNKMRPIGHKADMGAFERGFGHHALFVKEGGTGIYSGTDWNNAIGSVQDALAYASEGDTIYVAAGTFYPDMGHSVVEGDRSLSFHMKPNVAIMGGYAGVSTPGDAVGDRDIDIYVSILSGDISQTPNTTVDDAYVVVRAVESGIDRSDILDGFTIRSGNGSGNNLPGGVFVEGVDPTIRNCVIENNFGDNGGGMRINNASPRIEKCLFNENFNLSISGSGGAISSYYAFDLDIIDCQFDSNFSFFQGGALEIGSVVIVEITNCSFTNNTTGSGGAIYCNGGVITCSFSSFSGNSASSGQVYSGASTSQLNMDASIAWGNNFGGGNEAIVVAGGGTASVSNSIVQVLAGTYPGTGNLNSDPLFMNTVSNLRLQAGSPAIDYITTSSHPPFDQDGVARPIGAGADIGAYEYGDSVPCVSAYSIVNGNALMGDVHANSTFKSSGLIQSSQKIQPPASVIYSYGTELDLLPGFEALVGSQLETSTDGCD